MAMNKVHLLWLRDCVKNLANKNMEISVGCFGYPDLLATEAEVIEVFGEDFTSKLVARSNGKQKALAHKQQLEKMYSIESLFENLSCSVTVYDIVQHVGSEILVDLNQPLPESIFDKHHIIIDPGTLEHCFNVATAIKNMTMALKVGGYLIHHNPMIILNHGFYNFSPTFYYDFYFENDFEIVSYPYIDKGEFSSGVQRDFCVENGNCNNLLVRKKSNREISWPQQGTHLKIDNPDNTIIRQINTLISENKTVGLCPAGSITSRLLDKLEEHSAQLHIYDNKLTNLKGIDVIPTELLPEYSSDIIIITSYSYAYDIVKQLNSLGFPESNILIADGIKLIDINTFIPR